MISLPNVDQLAGNWNEISFFVKYSQLIFIEGSVNSVYFR